jgi:hypothetical protein
VGYQGVFKKGSRRRKEADFGAKNAAASLPWRPRLLRRFLNLVLRFINTTTFAARGFWPRRGASDAHTLPGSVVRVLGLDGAPEVKTLRRKLARLAAHERDAEFGRALVQRRVALPLRIQ